jgi:small-conductance mechanosensitive channel
MPLLESILELLREFTPFLVVVAAVVLCLAAVRWLLLRKSLSLGNERRLPRQLVLLGLSAIGIVAAVLALPVPDVTRNQLLTVLGLLVSAIIALSSTTLVANAMAGLMLRATKSFRTGDFIRVESQFGRVTERGLLDTEIQTEDRELTTLPNLYLISNPVTVVRSSGTIVSVSLSLGYDVHHAKVEPLLLEAARKADLEEPFVRVLDLGNFSVTYRISGFLADIKEPSYGPLQSVPNGARHSA